MAGADRSRCEEARDSGTTLLVPLAVEKEHRRGLRVLGHLFGAGDNPSPGIGLHIQLAEGAGLPIVTHQADKIFVSDL
jgi:hypothetical protein